MPVPESPEPCQKGHPTERATFLRHHSIFKSHTKVSPKTPAPGHKLARPGVVQGGPDAHRSGVVRYRLLGREPWG